MDEIKIEVVKKRIVKGAVILTARTFIMQLIALLANALLTVFLEPTQYGVFFLVSAVISFLTYFSDIGFAAALIQKKEKLNEAELRTIFTTQQALILILILVVYLITPFIKKFYNLNTDAVYLLWALTFSLFLSSLKIIPSVLMERRLEFNKLIIPQLVETILFNIVAVTLAWKGFGITSFTIAVLVRGFSGFIITYLIQPWMPALSFSNQALRSILKFGLPYQLNNLMAMVKDDGITLFLGSILGTGGVGLLAWAQKWAFAPLRFFMDQVIKVTFPAFSRLQDNKKELSNALSKSILYICLLVFPSLVMLVLLAPSLVEIIPKYSKWGPALLALTLLTANSALAAITTPITNTLNAIGKIAVTFKLMIMWTVLTWILVPVLTLNFGLNGAALGFTLVSLSSVVALLLALKYIQINYLQVVSKPVFVSVILGIAVFAIKKLIPTSIEQVVAMVVGGLFTYTLSVLILEPKVLTFLKFKKKMFRILVLLFALFLSFFLTPTAFAKSNNFISIVNPVRGVDFWELKDQQPQDAILGQLQILKQYNLPATWLIRFDALDSLVVFNQLPHTDEKGLFLEVTPSWTNQAGVEYHESKNWHTAGNAFLTGYELAEREKLIDTAFDKFKKIFGYFPKSVGAWWVDSHSLSYMERKYGISAALIVADQYTTDNYQIWGQYFSSPYYPSKNNVLHPAQTLENKLPVIITQWAARDPINAYGDGVFESTFSVQANDYTDFHKLDKKYFSKLIDIYTSQEFNKLSHLIVGLENSYFWDKYKSEYQNQIKILSEKSKTGQFSIVTLQDFASWYKQKIPNLPPEQIIVADDPLGTFKKVVWFMNPYYRAGWFYNQNGSVFRDIRQYIDGEEELCFKKRCYEINFATSATRVLDEVSFGQKWVLDDGKINNFKVTKTENFVITYTNEAGKQRRIEFLPRDIAVDGKISSIDTIILESTKKDFTKKHDSQIEEGFFEWSAADFLSKSIRFILFLILVVLIPGIILTKRINIFLSITVGLIFLTLVFYLVSLLKIRFLVPIYILVTLILFFRLRLLNKLQIPNLKKFNLPALGLILLGTIFQVIPTFRSSLIYPYGMGLWGPNTHDGLWHISLINQLVKAVPPQNPIFAGTILKNYHYFYDLLIAATNSLSQIPIIDLVFRFYPLLFSLMLGVGTYYLMTYLFKNTLATLFSLYLVYFAGSFGWIIEYIKLRHFGGESAFWANQAISFNLNPPFAISLLMVIAILQLLLQVKSKISIIVLTILCGTLVAFKSYAAVLILLTLFLVGAFKIDKQYLLVFLFSSLVSVFLFISNFSVGQQLIIFSPFWFIHSMIDSPDRVGWIRLSLARTTGWEQGNWFKFITAEVVSLAIFIIGNLGIRMFALLALHRIKHIVRQPCFLFIFILAILSFTIPILFIQAGNPWNTIQFLYYGLYISALVSAVVSVNILLRFNRAFAIVCTAVTLVIIPINSWVTANSYLSYQPHATISKNELQALKFLSSLDDGVILTYPYDEKLKKSLAEPWPILAYDSTAYVSALSKRSVYLEDEPQNQVLLTDYKKRLVASKDFFLKPEEGFLQDNQIKYIYLPKIVSISLSEGEFLDNIFENDEVIIYKVR